MDVNGLDYSKIPLHALKRPVQNILSTGLNHLKVLPNKNGLPRDWRGIAHLIELNGVETGRIATTVDPFMSLMTRWGERGNLELLQKYLKIIDRFDVLDDAQELLVSDSLEYLYNIENLNTPSVIVNLDSDKNILTTDDVSRLKNGMEPQIYDAYVLYAEEDINFAIEIVDTLEYNYNLKLCIRDRNLIGGVQFEHDAIAKLIAERCRRLVVIVSPNFLKSKANKFFVTFAQALALDIRERKVIPILYQKCNVPPELSYYFCLDYNRASKLWNFWEKLRDSIQSPDVSDKVKREVPIKTFSNQTKTDYWISRTHFEDKVENGKESERITKEEIMTPTFEPETVKSISKKKNNMYKIIKNSFGKGGRQSSQHSNKSSTNSHSLLATLTSFMSNNHVLLENLDSSQNLEDLENNIESKKVKSKKKWFKKKNLETLLS